MLQEENYIVDLQSLGGGEHEYTFTLEGDYLSGQEATELQDGKVDVEAQISVQARETSMKLHVSGVVQLVCDRCLDLMDYYVEINRKFRIRLADDDDDENLICVSPAYGKLDLAWQAYEQIVINLPLVHRHQDGGCNPQMTDLLLTHLASDDEDEQ